MRSARRDGRTSSSCLTSGASRIPSTTRLPGAGAFRLMGITVPPSAADSALHKRLERLEALLAARTSGPLRFVELRFSEALEETAARMAAAGELPQNCRIQGVETWRSRRKDHGHLPPTPRLPAPPELKLLPAPVQVPGSETRQLATKPEPPPDKGKRPWTADELRLALQGEDLVRAKFSKPIPYPRRLCHEHPGRTCP